MTIEQKIISYLERKSGIRTYAEVPPAEERPDKFFVVEKPGGGEVQLVLKTPQISILAYAPTKMKASTLCEIGKEAMKRFEYEPDILQVSLNTDHDYTNTAKKEYRYRMLYDIVHY